MDLLLTHAYFLAEDRHELNLMKPYPPLGILYLSAYLKKKGFEIGIFDSTFNRMESFRQFVEAERPSVVGIYINLTTRPAALQMMRLCKLQGCRVIVGGPSPAN